MQKGHKKNIRKERWGGRMENTKRRGDKRGKRRGKDEVRGRQEKARRIQGQKEEEEEREE